MRKAAIVTGMKYGARDVRIGLALRTAEEAKKLKILMVCADDGIPAELKRKLENLKVVFCEGGGGMGASRRKAMKKALKLVGKDGVYVWMEPEKHSLVSELGKAMAPVFKGRADLVVMERKSMSSYPSEQQLLEQFGNKAFFYITGRKLDVWFAAKAMNLAALKYFLEYRGEYGDLWDSVHIPLLRVIAAGLRIAGVKVNYVHPKEQTNNETGNLYFLEKRIDQLKNLVPAFHKEAKKLGLV